ncbi:unnamed protein product [Ectocarpus sp. 8 AP-2014]
MYTKTGARSDGAPLLSSPLLSSPLHRSIDRFLTSLIVRQQTSNNNKSASETLRQKKKMNSRCIQEESRFVIFKMRYDAVRNKGPKNRILSLGSATAGGKTKTKIFAVRYDIAQSNQPRARLSINQFRPPNSRFSQLRKPNAGTENIHTRVRSVFNFPRYLIFLRDSFASVHPRNRLIQDLKYNSQCFSSLYLGHRERTSNIASRPLPDPSANPSSHRSWQGL